jgi:subtilisin family serine protease
MTKKCSRKDSVCSSFLSGLVNPCSTKVFIGGNTVRAIIGLLLVATLSGCWFVKPTQPSHVSPDLTTVFNNPEVYLPGEDYVPNEYLVFVNRPADQVKQQDLEARIASAGFKTVTSYPLLGAVNVVDATPLAKPNVCGKLLVLVRSNSTINQQEAATLDGAVAGAGLNDEYSINGNTGGDGHQVAQQVKSAGIGQAWLRYLNALQVPNVKGLKVAVLDTGVTVPPSQTGAPYMTLSNPFNSSDYSGSSNVDDDFKGDSVIQSLPGHGTGVASLVAVQNIGTAPGATIVPVKFAKSDGKGTGLSMIQGVCHAVSLGVQSRVLNLSFGSLLSSSLAKGVVDDAINAGAVVVASAGNTRNTKRFKGKRCGLPNYPAAFSSGADANDGLIAVGGVKLKSDPVTSNDTPCDAAQQASLEAASVNVAPGYFTTLGKYVDIAAPGVGVGGLGTDGAIYTDFEGTSFAAPFVAGTAAQMLFKNPKLTPADVERILKSSVNVDASCPKEACGAGFLDVDRAIANTP